MSILKTQPIRLFALMMFAALLLCGCGPAGGGTDTSTPCTDPITDETTTDAPVADKPLSDAFPSLKGLGSEESPFLISSTEDLKLLSEKVFDYVDTRGLYFKQTADIDLASIENWQAIGTGGIPFEGHYDGDNHTVKNMTIKAEESFQGLFGFVDGTVKNVTVYGKISVHLKGHAYSHSFAGGIAGAMNNGSLVSGCKSYVEIDGDSYLGGVVGAICYTDDYTFGNETYSIIENCEFYGKIICDGNAAKNENAMYFGGITGFARGCVRNCINYGSIEVAKNGRYIGGIAGYVYRNHKSHEPSDALVEEMACVNCVNNGKVSGYREVGGIAGQTSLPIINCTNNGEVIGSRVIGGIIGLNGTTGTLAYNHTYIKDCKNTGKVYLNEQYAGGICGYSYMPVYSCENSGEVTGVASATRLGGISGYSSSSTKDCINSGKISGNQGVAGIVGWFEKSGSIIENCKNSGAVSSLKNNDAGSYHIGGIVGMLGSTNTVRGCENTGDVTGGGKTYEAGTGGIAGSLYSTSVIDSCKNSGKITAVVRVGGIAGFGKMNASSVISNCENSGEITSTAASGKRHLGGILGYGTSGAIDKCTNTGKLSHSTAADGAGEITGTVVSTKVTNSGAKE